MDFQTIEDAVAGTGLMVRGGFHPAAGEIPGDAKTLILVGNAGPAMWQAFSDAVPQVNRDQDRHPLDTWTKQVLDQVAADLGGLALYPFTGPPYHSFQAWAVRTGGVDASPTGPLIDPIYGLWHAYRGALAFDELIGLPEQAGHSNPCESCADKPCLSACPAEAFEPKGIERADYDVNACVSHIVSEAGRDCFSTGCLARHACPWGREYAYGSEQAAFHMVKFAAAHPRRG